MAGAPTNPWGCSGIRPGMSFPDLRGFLAELHRVGVARDTPPLVDPWRSRGGAMALQLGLDVRGSQRLRRWPGGIGAGRRG